MDFRIIHREQVGSTNDHAQERITKGVAAGGDVIWADEQTRGRGHDNNQWESAKGKNLTFSLILRPHFVEPAKQFVLTQLVSLAILNLLEKHIEKMIKIKWPNDVYVENEKIAGILIQNTLSGSVIDYSVIGIGLNVNQEHFLSDAPNPVSMIRFTCHEIRLKKLLDELLSIIGRMYGKLQSPAFYSELHDIYLDHLFRYEEWADYMANGEIFRAMITGINQFGQLKLKTEEGEEKIFGFKEVEFVL
ncbi:MAG: biotin--[acetyl-CoA-carboxylase] ligase [Chlorobi bacterium]|nr:biotin--[acetyl-CoA-carboxylase] ligase [Chlorobiota bacterium]